MVKKSSPDHQHAVTFAVPLGIERILTHLGLQARGQLRRAARLRRKPTGSSASKSNVAALELTRHLGVCTGGGKASTKLPQFKAVNTFLGNLKRSLGGTYHAFDFAKYAHRYLAEAQYRFNHRFNLRSILARLVRAACLTNPTPVFAIRVAEVGR